MYTYKCQIFYHGCVNVYWMTDVVHENIVSDVDNGGYSEQSDYYLKNSGNLTLLVIQFVISWRHYDKCVVNAIK